jgi:hypothetical protein
MACTQTSFTVSLNVEPILREREKTKNKGLNSGSAALVPIYSGSGCFFFSSFKATTMH